MRCVHCGCEKDAGAFSGAQKKKPVAKRTCISCTAAAATSDGGGSVAARSSSGLSAAAAHREASQGTDDTLSTRPSTAATPASGTGHGGSGAASAEQGGAVQGCAACGKQPACTVDNHPDWKKCGRCKQAFYCGKACQVEHWKRGGHKKVCKEPMACGICLDNDGPPLPIQSGCGCREEAGCAHVACKAAYAKHQGPGFHEGWYACSICKQHYTGAMQFGLAEALLKRLQGRPAKDQHGLAAQNNLANAYSDAGRHAEAEALYQDILATNRRVLGPNHRHTLAFAGNLGNTLQDQGNHSAAEAIFLDTLERQKGTLGPEHESTLRTASSLATSLQNQSKDAEAEPVLRETLAIQQRVLGEGDIGALVTADNLAVLLMNTGQHTEAEAMGRGALAQANRTLGPNHPLRLAIASALAMILGRQGQALGRQGHVTEAETLFNATLATQQRLLGPGHSDTQLTAQRLRRFQQHLPSDM